MIPCITVLFFTYNAENASVLKYFTASFSKLSVSYEGQISK
jgi:hypothetical protein